MMVCTQDDDGDLSAGQQVQHKDLAGFPATARHQQHFSESALMPVFQQKHLSAMLTTES